MQKTFVAEAICTGLLISAVFSFCATAAPLAGSGKTANETRKPGAYHAINLKIPADLTVEVGTAGDLSLQADDNLLPHIKTTVANGELLINADQNFNNFKGIVIKAKTAKLDQLEISGAANTRVKGISGGNLSLTADGASSINLESARMDKLTATLKGASKLKSGALNAGSVTVTAQGACAIAMDGKTDRLQAKLDGASNIKAADLTAKSATVSLTGAGSAEVNATVDLNATITGAGSVKYRGNPKVTKQILGVGSVAKF
jgi:hypothetical protein